MGGAAGLTEGKSAVLNSPHQNQNQNQNQNESQSRSQSLRVDELLVVVCSVRVERARHQKPAHVLYCPASVIPVAKEQRVSSTLFLSSGSAVHRSLQWVDAKPCDIKANLKRMSSNDYCIVVALACVYLGRCRNFMLDRQARFDSAFRDKT